MQILTGVEYEKLSKLITEGNKVRQGFKEILVSLKMCLRCKNYVKYIADPGGTCYDGFEYSEEYHFYCKIGGFEIRNIGVCNDFKKRKWKEPKIVISR